MEDDGLLSRRSSETASVLLAPPTPYGSVDAAWTTTAAATAAASGKAGTQLLHRPRAVRVRQLSYTVRPPFALDYVELRDTGLRRPPPKRVLHDVSFDLPPSQLMAVLGSSGSGKTTLLDLMACREDGGQRTGTVLIDNEVSTPALIKRIGGYVVQEDRLLPLLTVRETLVFVAQMKMPASWTDAVKAERVNAVMSELGLRHVADTCIGGQRQRGISGGERRRVSIAAQLLLDPGLLFLDEPTSGLDAFTAFHICETLQRLARAGRTVITTIHAPRSDIFHLFDQLMLLTQGHIAYYGSAEGMPAYFAGIGHPCPAYSNPCDFYVDLTTVSFRSVDAEAQTRATVNAIVAAYSRQLVVDDTKAEAAVPPATAPEPAKTSGWRQFTLLLLRSFRHQLKDRDGLILDFVQTLTISLVIGVVFWMLGRDQVSVSDRFGCIYNIATLYMFMAGASDRWMVRGGFLVDTQRPAFYLERQDGLYELGPYVWAEGIADLPFTVFFTLLYALPIYFMTALDVVLVKVLLYLAIVFLGIQGAKSFASAVAAGVVRFQQTAFVANFIYTLLLLPGGFLFNLDDLWVGLAWFGEISYLSYGFKAMSLNEFDGLTFDCPEYEQRNVTCPIATGEDALVSFGLEDVRLDLQLVYMVLFIVVCRALQYVLLRFVDQRPRR